MYQCLVKKCSFGSLLSYQPLLWTVRWDMVDMQKCF